MKALDRDELSFQYIPWYVRDYLEDLDIMVLSCAAEGCRARLLCLQWLKGSLPASPDALRALTRATAEEWPQVWAQLESHFPLIDGARRNPGLHELRQQRESYIEQQRQRGKLGGRPRRGDEPTGEKPPVNPRVKPSVNRGDKPADNQPLNPVVKPPVNQGDKPRDNQPPNHLGNQKGKPTETLDVVVGDIPLSPPPSGGGSSPAPREARASRSEFEAALDEAVTLLEPGPARDAVRRLLDEERVPIAALGDWVAKISGWTQGIGTTGMRAVSPEAIAQGLSDLRLAQLSAGADRKRVTPKVALIFAEDAQRTMQGASPSAAEIGRTARAGRTLTLTDRKADAVAFARNGDPEAQAWCRAHDVDYTQEVA